MKNLILILILIHFFSMTILAQSPPPPPPPPQKDGQCNCLIPASKTINWCIGPRGGTYCISKSNNKIYKKR